MEQKQARLWPWGAVILAGLMAYGGLQLFKSSLPKPTPSAAPSITINVGAQLPEFALTDLNGKSTSLTQLGAKLYLVNFWASWCEACMVEMPSIAKLHQKLKAQGLEVLAISVDSKPEMVVPPLVKKLSLPFPIYTDTEQKLSDLFQVEAIPLTVVLNEKREVLMIHRGEEDWASPEMIKKFEHWMKN